jgi:REP element-mobilizing transposase RayT
MLPLGFVVHLLTFNCYGTHLRGDEKGSLDRAREGRGGPIEPSSTLVNYGKRTMTHAEARLDLGESFLVLSAIRETCAFRHWTLLAAHVRSTHAHLVVDGIMEASCAIRDFKAYASRALNGEGVHRRWARGGNARLLHDSRAVRAAVRYVVDCQGPPMAAYIAPDL